MTFHITLLSRCFTFFLSSPFPDRGLKMSVNQRSRAPRALLSPWCEFFTFCLFSKHGILPNLWALVDKSVGVVTRRLSPKRQRSPSFKRVNFAVAPFGTVFKTPHRPVLRRGQKRKESVPHSLFPRRFFSSSPHLIPIKSLLLRLYLLTSHLHEFSVAILVSSFDDVEGAYTFTLSH